MSEETKIEWCDSTINFWEGCTKVSDGCKNCYAAARDHRFTGGKLWGKGAARRKSKSAVKLAFKLNEQPWICDECGMAHQNPGSICMTWHCGCETRHRRRVFSLSLGDWLDPEIPIEWLAEMLDTIRQCDQLQWLLVTKRPQLLKIRMEQVVILENISGDLFQWVRLWLWQLKGGNGDTPKHVMVLTSVENQAMAEKRIPELLKIPAARRGLSCEPLLGELDLSHWLIEGGGGGLDWVIVGGESGHNARPCQVEWIRDLKDQCAGANVPCFVKQLGTAAVQADPEHDYAPFPSTKKGGDMTEWPQDLRVRQFYDGSCPSVLQRR